MPLFVCDGCGDVENTACCGADGYWLRKMRKYRKGDALCSECNPAIGKWHGRFEKIDPEEWEERNPFTERELLNR